MADGDVINPNEATNWLKTHPHGLHGNRFNGADGALEYVELLYRAGAEAVLVEANSTLVVKMPTDAEARNKIIAMYNTERSECDQDFGGEPEQERPMTREEAVALGNPDLEGAPVLEDATLYDKGQTEIRFWWD